LHASGSTVAFHAKQTGTYLNGLAGIEPHQSNAVLHCNGLVHVRDGKVESGRVIRDRVGLKASLQKAKVNP
jgi:hypothetical protein